MNNFIVHPCQTSITTIALPLSADGGCSLTTAGHSHVVMSETQLRALDLRNCPDIEIVDLQASTQVEIHVSVISCPRLRKIILPTHAKAYVHIDTDDQKPSLQVIGGVVQIDAAWIQGRFEKQAAPDTSWTFASIGTLEELQSWNCSADDHGLWVVVDSNDCSTLDLNPPESVTEVVFTQLNLLKHLRWFGNEKSSIDIRNAQVLRTIDIFTGCTQISLSASPKIALIEGSAHIKVGAKLLLNLQSGDVNGLHLNLPFTDITLVDSKIKKLVTYSPKICRLLRCYSLIKIHLPPTTVIECEGHTPQSLLKIASITVNESTINNALERIRMGDSQAWLNLRKIIPLASSSKQVPLMLKGLERAMELGCEIEDIWTTRVELYLRHVTRTKSFENIPEHQLMRGVKEWRWTMVSDLGADGWRADWRIWQRGVEANIKHLQKMTQYMVLSILGNKQAAGALLPWLLRDEPGQTEFLTAFFTALNKDFFRNDEAMHFKNCAKRAAIPAQNTPTHKELAKVAREYLCKVMPLENLIVELQTWLHHSPVETRILLVQLSVNPMRHNFGKMDSGRFHQLAKTLLLGGRLPEPVA